MPAGALSEFRSFASVLRHCYLSEAVILVESHLGFLFVHLYVTLLGFPTSLMYLDCMEVNK